MASSMGMIIRDTIGPALAYMVVNTANNVQDAMESGRAEIEAYAQMNAPWSDNTGDARNGLTASVYEEGGEIVLELAHSVDYGIWLELIQDGRYAIIMPTLEMLGPEVIEAAGGQVTRTGSTF